MLATVLLLVGFIDPEPTLPPVHPTDLYRFGIRARFQTQPEYEFTRDYLEWSTGRSQMHFEPQLDWERHLQDAHYLWDCWNTLDNVACNIERTGEEWARQNVCSNLTHLRYLIGWRAYYAGWMPSTQPYRSFRAELTPPDPPGDRP